MCGVRSVAAETHVSVDQTRGELLERRVNKDEQVDEASHVRPAGQLEAQVVALRDDDAVDLDGQGGGDGLVQVAPVIGGEDHAVRAAHAPQEGDVSAHVEGVGRALVIGDPARGQHRVGHVEAIHGREARDRDAGLGQGACQLGGDRRLAGPGRAGQAQHAHGVTEAGALGHGLDDALGDRRGLGALRRGSSRLRS